ncbi:hypothetical protein ADICYQ_1321 [Cyclobacterium qasimii M12-11B]|uniref:Uncharacterized protein n=1 Tax=Cyclobacterium qasimii M12-11B TaxID=641524 RepID=S7VHQ4_9BACT|nr:hypothetical protein ADICYQ_1321 [Cyclobacterium qasimii M12-11B]
MRFEFNPYFNKRNNPLILGLIIPGKLITIDAKNLLRLK